MVTADRVCTTVDGEDVTVAYVRGAQRVAREAQERGLSRAILQARSPSCGCGGIYDGTHTGRVVGGDGVLAAMLKAHGVEVVAARGNPGN